jgi:hypothetical protein
LDTLQINLGGEDLTTRQLTRIALSLPAGGAGIAVFGASQPTFNDCKNMNLGGQAVVINDLNRELSAIGQT